MLKPLTTIFRDHEITLECTHKKIFPPPQMYGSTPEDIDTLWKQGVIDQNQYQQLRVWKEKCGIMVMGPRCLDCPLAKKQNPRPGRPNVIETESWLAAKEKMHWADMKAGKLAPPEDTIVVEGKADPVVKVSSTPETVVSEKGFVKQGTPVPVAVVEPQETEPAEVEAEETLPEEVVVEPEPEKETLLDALKDPDKFLVQEADPEPESDDGLGDDILDALADD